MSAARQLFRQPTDWLLASPLAAYGDAFTRYLSERHHASKTIPKYLSCLAHFGRWMSQCRLNIERIDEDLVRRFLDDHLPRCDCAWPGGEAWWTMSESKVSDAPSFPALALA